MSERNGLTGGYAEEASIAERLFRTNRPGPLISNAGVAANGESAAAVSDGSACRAGRGPQAASLDVSGSRDNGATGNRRSTRNLIEAISPQRNVV